MAQQAQPKEKYLSDLKEWGVDVPDGAKYQDIKTLWEESHEAREARATGVIPEGVVHIPGGAISPEALAAAVEAYMAKREKETTSAAWSKEDMREMLEAVKNGPTNALGQLRGERIAPNDRIPPVTFFCPYPRYYIAEKWSGDYAEALPIGMGTMLKFRQEFSYCVRSGDIRQTRFLSVLVVSSLLVYKWLTGEDLEGNKVGAPHEGYNRVFYRNANRAIERSDNSLRAQIFDKHLFGLSSLRFDQLVQRASELGLPANVDWNNIQYRSAIADKLTDNELASMASRYKEQMREYAANELLLKQEGIVAGITA